MISNKQRTALVAVAVLVLAVAGDMLQAHQAQAQTNIISLANRTNSKRDW